MNNWVPIKQQKNNQSISILIEESDWAEKWLGKQSDWLTVRLTSRCPSCGWPPHTPSDRPWGLTQPRLKREQEKWAEQTGERKSTKTGGIEAHREERTNGWDRRKASKIMRRRYGISKQFEGGIPRFDMGGNNMLMRVCILTGTNNCANVLYDFWPYVLTCYFREWAEGVLHPEFVVLLENACLCGTRLGLLIC